MSENSRQERILKGVYRRTLGRRTFALISSIGVKEVEVDDSSVTTYAQGLDFQLPDQDVAHTLLFSASKGRLLTSDSRRILNVSAVLRVKGDEDSLVAIDVRDVNPDVFVQGTSVPGNSRWLGREAVPKYKASVDGFKNLLEVGEGLVGGKSAESMLDRLPFLVSGDIAHSAQGLRWENPSQPNNE